MQWKFIDREYYTSVYKADLNARIEGDFNKVYDNNNNFDAYNETASLIFDRLTGGKISKVGGIEYFDESGLAKTCAKKFVAQLIEFWFIRGFDLATITQQVNNGTINVSKNQTIDSFRNILPLNAIATLQLSGLWVNKLAPIITKETIHLSLNEIVTWNDALAYFERKGEFDNNFHSAVDFSNELTNQDTTRYIKIVDTPKQHISFELVGGDATGVNKALLIVDSLAPTNVSKSGAFAYIPNIDPNATPNVEYYFNKNTTSGNNEIWVKLSDKTPTEVAKLLISNVYADEVGEYKLFGSNLDGEIDVTNFKKITQSNILKQADITNLANDITALQAQLTTFNTTLTTITNNISNLPQLNTDVATIKSDNITIKQDLIDRQSDVVALSNNLFSLSGVVENRYQELLGRVDGIDTRLNSGEFFKADGNSTFPTSYAPTAPKQATPKDYVDQLVSSSVSNALQQNPNISGWLAKWDGSLAGVKKASGDLHLTFSPQSVTAQTGTLSWLEGQRVEITFENGNEDDNPEIMYVRADNKVNKLEIEKSTADFYYKGHLGVGGELEIHKFDVNNDNEIDLPITEIRITRLYQVNGVQTPADTTMDDATVAAYEAVVMN